MEYSLFCHFFIYTANMYKLPFRDQFSCSGNSDRHCVVSTLQLQFWGTGGSRNWEGQCPAMAAMENLEPHIATPYVSKSSIMFYVVSRFHNVSYARPCGVASFCVLFFRILPQVAVATANLPFCTFWLQENCKMLSCTAAAGGKIQWPVSL
jgi:hypothetical protein